MSLFPAYTSLTDSETQESTSIWTSSFASFPKEITEDSAKEGGENPKESNKEVAKEYQICEYKKTKYEETTERSSEKESTEEGEYESEKEKSSNRSSSSSEEDDGEKKDRQREKKRPKWEGRELEEKRKKESSVEVYERKKRRSQERSIHLEGSSKRSTRERRFDRDSRDSGKSRYRDSSEETHKERRRKRKGHEEERRKHKKRKKEWEKSRKKFGCNSNAADISDGQVFARFNRKLVFSDGTRLPPEEAFRVDTVGEKDNLTFDRTPAKNTARFRSFTSYTLGYDFESSRKSRRRADRYFDSRRAVNPDDIERVIPAKGAGRGDLPSLIEGSVVNEGAEGNPLGVYDPATSAYIVASADAASETKAVVEDEETAVRKQVRDFNKMLSKNPKDLDLWLKYVDFQDKAVAFENDSGKRRKPNETYLAEKKIAILDRAIGELPNKIELVIKRLHVGENIWTNDELRLRWLDAFKVHPANVQLWNAYFDFVEHFGEFKVGDVLSSYRRCMKKLTGLLVTLEGKRKRDLEADLRGIFSRLCVYLKNVGYTEKAVGLYQMQLELAVRTPGDVKSSYRFSVLLEMADRFWDSHVPRIGEEGSEVWTSVLASTSRPLRRDIQGSVSEEKILKSHLTKSEKWLQLECCREKAQWQPWTPTEEVDEVEDKDRLVALENLKPYLFQVSNPFTAVGLVIDFLRLLGCFDKQNRPVVYTSFNLGLLCDVTVPNTFQTPSYSVEESVLGEGSDSAIVRFVHTLISQCFPHFDVPEQITLLTFWLSFEKLKLTYMNGQRRVTYWKYLKKKLKTFMSGDKIRENVLVYTKFIELCDAAGECEQASKFFGTLFLCQEKSLFDLDLPKKANLIKALLASTNFNLKRYQSGEARWEEVLSPLVQALCEEKYSSERLTGSASVLRAKSRALALVSELGDESDDLLLRVLWGCCCLYLTFFVDGFAGAVRIFKKFFSELEGKDVELEELHSTILNLGIAAVQLKQPGSFSLLADLLVSLVRSSPAAFSVISAFLEYQIMSRGSRRLLTHGMKAVEDLTENELLVFGLAVSYMKIHENLEEGEEEQWRETGTPSPVKIDGLKFRIKHFFESSMTHPTCRKSVLLWRIYLKFLQDFGFKDGLRSASYLAMKECPFSRDMLMDVIKLVPESMEAVYKLMNDKDMRVRIPLEELDLLLEDLSEANV